jgi:hypothetical protein
MPCDCSGYTPPATYLVEFLCKTCRFLTAEQMKGIQAFSDIVDLLDWYLQHLDKDLINGTENERKFVLNEYKRLGFSIKYHYSNKYGGRLILIIIKHNESGIIITDKATIIDSLYPESILPFIEKCTGCEDCNLG